MLGVFAEFETNLRRERQMEGIAAAKLRGVYKGRPASIDAAKVAALKAEGLGATEIAKRLGVGRASVYRVLASPTAPIAPEATPDAGTASQPPRSHRAALWQGLYPPCEGLICYSCSTKAGSTGVRNASSISTATPSPVIANLVRRLMINPP
jgi:hypothetical protein